MTLESLFQLIEIETFISVSSGWLFLTSICLFLWLSTLLYRRRTWGKLPPGPRCLPLVGYLPFLGNSFHKTLWKLKEKYGDVFGIYVGRDYTVVLSEQTVVKEVLSHPAALDRNPHFFDHLPYFGFGSGNGEKWLEQRRFCLSTTRDLGLGKIYWEELITEETNIFLNLIQKQNGEPTEISNELAFSVSTSTLSFLIGRKLRKDEEAEEIQNAVEVSEVAFIFMCPSFVTSVLPGFRGFCEFFKIGGYDRAFRTVRQFSSFIRDEVYRHQRSSEQRTNPDFINVYLEKISKVSAMENKKHSFTESMLEGNITVLFAAAGDTICSSIIWLLRLMVKHKEIQRKVYSELMNVLGKNGRARYEERYNIPYTFAVLMEAQRVSSIVPLIVTRRATQDIHVRGYLIPKGANIFANFWGLHNDPTFWDEPELFRPERFLTDDGTKLIKEPPSYVPFSIGKRNCPGFIIAWTEILIYFTEIIKKFEVSLPEGVDPVFNIVNSLISSLEPQQLHFKLRKDN